MKWLEIHIDTRHDALETVEAFLSSLGIDDLVIDDETEFQDFLEQNHQYWDYVDEDLERSMAGRCRITFYLEENEAGFARLGEIRIALAAFKKEHPACGSCLLTLADLDNADWENNWKQYYKPLKIGRRLLVIPEWESAENDEGRVPLILNPGLTFGTGSHATTRLCLTALEQEIRGGETVLDLGCGSGILSIAALKLGAGRAVAVDIDDKCLDVAWENAGLNGVGRDRYDVRVGDVLADPALTADLAGQCDLVLANIVADVIIALAPQARRFLKPGGQFLCSGIIDDRAEEVAQALRANGWTLVRQADEQGWFSYLCR